MGARRAIGCVAGAIVVALPTTARTQGTRLHGLVYDSVAALPLAGAHVELVNFDDRSRILFTTTSDSFGRFVLDSVARGRYIAGFIHPMLDSLGLAISQRLLTITSDGDIRFDLAVPSPERIEGALCGGAEDKNTNGAVIGYVLNSHSLAAADSTTVIAAWTEIIFGNKVVGHEVLSRRATTDANGWFVVCGVPTASSVILRAVSGSDTSGAIELDIPKSRIARRNLYVDHLPLSDRATHLAPISDSVAGQSRNGALLTGWVRTEDGVPIPGARVRVYSSDVVARTNDEGGFQLAGIPGGTQTLNTRAIGFVPDDRAVDLTDRHVPVVIGLLTIRRFLDTVHVHAAKSTLMSAVGFDERKRGGAGQFFTANDIERFHPHEITDVLRHAPGISVSTDNQHNVKVRMRGDMESCTPAIFLDGKQLINWELSDLNALVEPATVGAMEVYTLAMTPAEFRTKQGCGTILLWTRSARR
jgi:hypothetical protein